jgi:hypothetical protein
MTQTGGRQRAEATDRAISTLRAELASVQPLIAQVRVLEARLQASEHKIAVLESELTKLKAVGPASTA